MSSILEASTNLDEACKAFDAFMVLLTGTDSVETEGLFYLLQPIQDKITQARGAATLALREPRPK